MVAQAQRELVGSLEAGLLPRPAEGGGLREALQRMAEVQEVMTLLESHADQIQEQLYGSGFPNAPTESHFNLACMLLRLFGARKLARYHDGVPAVASAIASGEVEGLYANV